MKKTFKRWIALAAVAALVLTTVVYQYTPQLRATDADGTYATEPAAEQQTEVQEVVLEESAEGDAQPEEEPVDETLTAENEEAAAEESSGSVEKPAAAEEEAVAEEEPAAEEEEEVKMPAQTLTAKASDGAAITVKAAEGVLPEGASVKVTVVSAKSVIDAIEVEAGEVEDLAAYDIIIVDKDGNEIQPKGDVSVTIRNADIDASGDGEAAVYHVSDDKASAELVEEVSNVENASFTAEHFSVYALVKAAEPEEDAVYTIEWYVDGKLVKTTTSNAGERPESGLNPTKRSTHSGNGQTHATFEGWATAQHGKDYKAEDELPEVTEDAKYYAVFTSPLYTYALLQSTKLGSNSSSDYVYIGGGKVIVPDGLELNNRDQWFTGDDGVNLNDLIIAGPEPSDIIKGLEAKYQDFDADKWTYSLDWYELRYGEYSRKVDGWLTPHGRLHMNGALSIHTEETVGINYMVKMPNGEVVTKSTVHKPDESVEINSTVNLDNATFTTDGHTQQSKIDYNGNTYEFRGWYEDSRYSDLAPDSWVVDGVKTFYGRYVTGDEIVVMPGSATKTYDGQSLTKADASEAVVTGLPDDYSYEVTTAAKAITDVGTSEVTVTGFIIKNEKGEDVTGDFTNITKKKGALEVTPRQVTLTSETASKEYDGTPLMKPEVAVRGDGFVEGEVTDVKATGSITEVGSVTNTITYKEGDGFKADNYVITKTEGTLTVTSSQDEVVVTIVGHNDSVEYDGEAHKVTGYDVEISNDLYTENDFTFSGTATAEQTEVGTAKMGLTEEQFANNNANFTNVTFIVTDGYMTVTPIDVTVTIVGNHREFDYDGTERTVTGYEVTEISNELYTEGDFDFNGTAEAKRTDAGTTPMNLTADQFENTNGNFANVTFIVTDGYVTVRAEEDEVVVTITGRSDTQTYDGEAHTVNGYDVTISNDLYTENDFTFSGTATAEQTEVGTAKMGLTEEQFANNNANFTNVTFVVTDGFMSITPAEVTVTITENSKSVTYNGQEQSVTGYTVDINNALYTDAYFEGPAQDAADAMATGTDVGSYDMSLEANQFSNKNDNFDVTFEIVDGKLTITPISAQLLVQALSTEKVYDGEALERKEYAIADSSKDVLASGHRVIATVEGSVTDVQLDGDNNVISVANTISNIKVLDASDNDVTVNYARIKGENGTLKILPRSVTLKSETASKVYDGEALTKPDVTIGGAGFVKGDGVTAQATGTVTNVSDGVADNTIAITGGNSYKESNYTISKEEGKLQITPKAVTITAADSGKVYGENDPAFTGNVEGLVKAGDLGEITYSRTNAEINDVGIYEDVITASYTANDNYSVTVIPGTFTIVEANADGTAAALTAFGGTWQYDGTAHAASAAVSGTAAEGYVVSYSVDGGVWSLTAPSVTNVSEGTVAVDVKAERAGYKTLTAQAEISITPRQVILTSESAEKEYDGTALERPNVTVTGGFVNGEVRDVKATGSITDVGSVENKIVFTPNQATYRADNYNIIYNEGTLIVTAIPSYALTIHYVDEDGNPMAPDYTGTYQRGAAFHVESPDIPGYTPNYASISSDENGMPAQDLEFTVVYSAAFVPVIIDTPDGPVPTPVPVEPPVVPDAPAGIVVPGPAPAPAPAPAAAPAPAPAAVAAPADLVVVEDTMTPLANIQDGETPLAAMDHWALLNLILTIFTALMSIVLLVLYFKKKKDDEEAEAARMENKEDTREVRRRGLPRILSAVWAVLMIIVFFLTEDMTLPMQFTDEWTWLMVCMTIMQLCIMIFAKKVYDDERKEPDAAV